MTREEAKRILSCSGIGYTVEDFNNALEVAFNSNTSRNLWHHADGDDLPEIDREVIVLLSNNKVCYAHRPNPNGWDGRSILTGEVDHYTPKTYDKGGWNIPDVKWWLDLDLPNMEEKL